MKQIILSMAMAIPCVLTGCSDTQPPDMTAPDAAPDMVVPAPTPDACELLGVYSLEFDFNPKGTCGLDSWAGTMTARAVDGTVEFLIDVDDTAEVTVHVDDMCVIRITEDFDGPSPIDNVVVRWSWDYWMTLTGNLVNGAGSLDIIGDETRPSCDQSFTISGTISPNAKRAHSPSGGRTHRRALQEQDTAGTLRRTLP